MNRFALALVLILTASFVAVPSSAETGGGGDLAFGPNPDPMRFDNEVARFAVMLPDPHDNRPTMLCIGSSSFRMWDPQTAFPEFKVYNCGFGGSEFSDVIYWWDRLARPVDPTWVLIYEGDNDTAARHKSVGQIYGDFREVVGRVRGTYPEAHLLIVPIKPSPARTAVWEEATRINRLMQDYADGTAGVHFALQISKVFLDESGKPKPELFRDDGVHLNAEGYALWNARLRAKVLP